MSFTLSPPEQHLAPSPTSHVPNSRLPVLVYRSAISSPTPASIQAAIEPNNWLKGGTWKHFPHAHFHSVTHELYVVFSGSSQLLLGRGKLDPPTDEDLILDVKVGDALVVPAGVAHCSLKSSDDYEYMGLYPKGSPHWDYNNTKAGVEETEEKAAVVEAVPIPEWDPMFGTGGPLVEIWRKALEKNS